MVSKVLGEIYVAVFILSSPSAFAAELFKVDSGPPVTVKNWSYVLQGADDVEGELQVTPLVRSPHDLLVMDFARFGDEDSKFTPSEVTQIKTSDSSLGGNGHRKIVAAYISIGEASEFRSYWDSAWTSNGLASGTNTANAPTWLGPVNPNFPESRKVRYWDPAWQAIITNAGRTGWLDQVVAQGFDAAYLDIIDAYFYWFEQGEKTEIQAAQDMIDFVVALAASARSINPSFFLIPQNGPFILDALGDADPTRKAAYLDAIGAIGVEDTYYFGDQDENNTLTPQNDVISVLKRDFLDNGIPVFSTDYVNEASKVQSFNDLATADGFYPFAAPKRDLNDIGFIGPSPGIPDKIIHPIKVDQFGYRPIDQKLAFISNPQGGYNSTDSFTPGSTYEVRNAENNSVVLSGSIDPWKSGATHSQSGDKVWVFDFSSVTAPGSYFVYDLANKIASHPFDIRDDIYSNVMKQAVRTFYYQRFNFSKQLPYAKPNWIDAASHTQSITATELDPTNVSVNNPLTAKDVSGGWYDAGDYSGFVNGATDVIHDLLFAFQENPDVWGDDYDIPESGNGVADLLDELKYELEWLLRMQVTSSDTSKPNFTTADVGSVLHKVSVRFVGNSTTPPSSDVEPMRYGKPSSTATISAAGAYAHAAIVFKAQANSTMQAFGEQLEAAAIASWNWLLANPAYSAFDNTGFSHNAADDTATEQAANKLTSAIYLFALTRETQYQTYVDINLADGLLVDPSFDKAYFDEDSFRIKSAFAQLFYAHTQGADSTNAAAIINRYTIAQTNTFVDWAPLLDYQNEEDAYRASMDQYHHGTNRAKGHAGNLMLSMNYYGLDTENSVDYRNAASGYIHYLHGTNPLGISYLSNMGNYGAELSVPEFYHLWYRDESDWDSIHNSKYGPPPGFLVGGPNEQYSKSSTVTVDGVNYFEFQPPQKAYRSFNDIDNALNTYEITEPSITYQAPYIRLLANFLPELDQGFSWDIDGDGEAKPLTDGLLNLRYLFGFRGETLIDGAVAANATRVTADEIEAYIENGLSSGDIDGDGVTKPLTDGLLLLRYLFGFRGDTLIQGAVDSSGTRQTEPEIKAYIDELLP